MGKAIFITGTNTGVGKSIVSAVLARLMKNRGVNVGIMKPVTSGGVVVDGTLISEDAELLKWSAGSTDDPAVYAPYIFKAPLAPSVAAAQEGGRVDFEVIAERFNQLVAAHDFVIVEGAGGLMVPLAGGLMVADLVRHLNIPLLVVARPNLGTINHTVLTTFAARQLDIAVTGIIVNDYPDSPGPAEEYAPHLLGSLSGCPVLGVFPHSAEEDPKAAVDAVVERVTSDPMTRIMLREIGVD